MPKAAPIVAAINLDFYFSQTAFLLN